MNLVNLESQTSLLHNFSKPVSKFSEFKAHFKVELDNAKLKLTIVLLLLLFSGSTSLISQVYMNDILKMVGFELKNPVQPDIIKFLVDFLGDSSLYVLVIIILGMGTFSNELEINKQVYFTLSRPVSRTGYYLTRGSILTIGIFVFVVVGSTIIYLYSTMFFTPLATEKFVLIVVLVSLQYSAFYALMIMFSTKFSQTMAGVLGLLAFVSEAIISFIPPLKWFSVLALSSDWVKILDNSIPMVELGYDFIAILIWIIIPILIGWRIYLHRDL